MNDQYLLEVEVKYFVDDEKHLRVCLDSLGAIELAAEHHIDTYYAHPCRDFRQTKEALRLRRINGQPFITYKGPKLPGDVKVRRELEWSLAPGDEMGELTEELWRQLGFSPVAVVDKIRRPFEFLQPGQKLQITIDTVQEVGVYAEIEILAKPANMEEARVAVLAMARKLELSRLESLSYLGLLLQNREQISGDSR